MYSCATITNPTGGPKDTTPPRIVRAFPPDSSINFSGQQVELQFNEFINLKDPSSQVIISPVLGVPADFKQKNKSLIITFKEKLQKNTSYTINLANAITDLTEGNAMEPYNYVFSTGPYLDSLVIKGHVTHIENQAPEKGISVMLYKNLSDTVILKRKPDFFTRTDTGGNFVLQNLAPGQYKLIALKDENNNYLYDNQEMLGFTSQPVDAKEKVKTELSLFKEEKNKQGVLKATALEFGKIMIVFNRPVKQFNLRTDFLPDTAGLIKEFNKHKDSLLLWYRNIGKDSTYLILSDGEFRDTLGIALIPKDNKFSKLKEKQKKLNIQTNLASPFDLEAAIKFMLSRPASEYDIKNVSLLEDSTKLENYILVAKDSVKRKFEIVYPWKEASHYHLLVPKGTFKDILGNENDTIKTDFTIKPADSYGNFTLRLHLADTTTNYIVQLLDEKDVLVQENFIEASQNVEYKYLNPGKYKARLIFDSNNNLRWDTGDYLNHVQPEKIIIYKDPIEIRAHWDLEADWKT